MLNLERILSKFDQKERELIISLIEKINSLDWHGLDVKKLKGESNIYRVRKGQLRIIFKLLEKEVFILTIERRSEKTYKNF